MLGGERRGSVERRKDGCESASHQVASKFAGRGLDFKLSGRRELWQGVNTHQKEEFTEG